MKYVLFLLSTLFISCGSSSSSNVEEAAPTLRDYYFPHTELFTAKVYKYKNEKAGTTAYWHMQTVMEGADTTLITQVFDNELNISVKTKELIGTDGITLLEYTSYISGEPNEGTVGSDEIYKWDQKERSKIVWSVAFDYDSLTEVVTRKKQFLGYEDEYPSHAKFRHDYSIRYTNADTSVVVSFFQNSYYAAGQGLFNYDRFIPESPKVSVEFAGTLTDKEWDKMVAKKEVDDGFRNVEE